MFMAIFNISTHTLSKEQTNKQTKNNNNNIKTEFSYIVEISCFEGKQKKNTALLCITLKYLTSRFQLSLGSAVLESFSSRQSITIEPMVRVPLQVLKVFAFPDVWLRLHDVIITFFKSIKG